MEISTASIPENLPGSVLDSRRLQMFLLAAREAGFAQAAQRLNVSPSAISHAMKSLEDELSCRLFRRAGPKVTLTGAGWRLLHLVERLMEQMDSIVREMSALAEHADRLRVSVPRAWCGSLLSKVLPDLYECYPKAQLEIFANEDHSEEQKPDAIDLTIGDSGDAPEPAVRRTLFEETLGFYVAPFDRMHLRPPQKITDVPGKLLLVADSSARRLLLGQRGLSTSRAPRTWLLPGVESVVEMARVGYGVAVLPDWAARHATAQGLLVPLKLSGPVLKRVCCAWWMVNRPPSWASEVFLSLVVTAWAEMLAAPEQE